MFALAARIRVNDCLFVNAHAPLCPLFFLRIPVQLFHNRVKTVRERFLQIADAVQIGDDTASQRERALQDRILAAGDAVLRERADQLLRRMHRDLPGSMQDGGQLLMGSRHVREQLGNQLLHIRDAPPVIRSYIATYDGSPGLATKNTLLHPHESASANASYGYQMHDSLEQEAAT